MISNTSFDGDNLVERELCDLFPSEWLRTAQTFMDQGDVWELRIPKAGRYKTISGYYDNTQTFADSIIGIANEGFPGFYFTANPVQPDLFARSANKYEKYAQNTTADGDTTRRRWLLVDLDPIRSRVYPHRTPSTQQLCGWPAK